MQTTGTFTQIGAVLGTVEPRRDARAKIRRHSRLKGREGTFWRPTDRRTGQRLLLAAKRYELHERQAGKRSGPLGPVAIEVLEYFVNLVGHKDGRLDPCLATIMERVKRSKDAVVRALKNLRAHGFLDWLRRYVPTGNETGPQYHQTSNAYRLLMPERARRLMGRYGRTPPVPDDFGHAQDEREAQIEAWVDAMSMGEQARFLIEDEGLAAQLERLGNLIAERESAKRSESLSQDSSSMR